MPFTGNITADSCLVLLAREAGHMPSHLHRRQALAPGTQTEPEWLACALVIACCGLIEAPIVGHVAVSDHAHLSLLIGAN